MKLITSLLASAAIAAVPMGEALADNANASIAGAPTVSSLVSSAAVSDFSSDDSGELSKHFATMTDTEKETVNGSGWFQRFTRWVAKRVGNATIYIRIK